MAAVLPDKVELALLQDETLRSDGGDGACARPDAAPAPIGLAACARRSARPDGCARRGARACACALVGYCALVYALVFLLVAWPSAQAVLVCMHWVKYVRPADFARPADVFVLGGRSLFFEVERGGDGAAAAAGDAPAASGGERLRLGAWHVLPVAALPALGVVRASGDAAAELAFFDAALRAPPSAAAALPRGGAKPPPLAGAASAAGAPLVVLFFHGNAEHRAINQGPIHQRLISGVLGAHALAVDWRGFGDSDGWPTEEGMAEDARAAWAWLMAKGVAPGSVLLWGHSLGAAVAARLAAELHAAAAAAAAADANARGAPAGGAVPLGLVLEAPFTSIPELLPDYPLGKAVCWLPAVRRLLSARLAFRMDNARRLRQLAAAAPRAPLLLLHGRRDVTVPHAHSEALLAAARDAGAERLALLSLARADHDNVLANDDVAIALKLLLAGGDWAGAAARASGADGGEPAAGAGRAGEAAAAGAARLSRGGGARGAS